MTAYLSELVKTYAPPVAEKDGEGRQDAPAATSNKQLTFFGYKLDISFSKDE